jgi:DNA segregation ATPase FtsK/SpoIIIE, S-DNA-T family
MSDQTQSNRFNRPPRIQVSFTPSEINIPPPPGKKDETTSNILMMLLPISGIVVMGLFYLLIYSGSSRGGSMGWLFALPMLAMGLTTLVATIVVFGEQKHQQKLKHIKQLRDYHRLLDKKESRLLASQELQLEILRKKHPPIKEVEDRIHYRDLTLWERRIEDPDFLTLRLGVGDVPSEMIIQAPDPDLPGSEIRRAFGIYTKYRTIPNAPITINLPRVGSVGVVGGRQLTLPFVYALLTQVVAFHSPDDMDVFVLSSDLHYRQWQWMRWLPHTSEKNEGGQPDYLSFGSNSNRRMIAYLSERLDRPQSDNDQDVFISAGDEYKLIIFDGETNVVDEPGYAMILREGWDRKALSIIICDTLEDVPSDCQSIIRIPDSKSFSFQNVGPKGVTLDGIPETTTIVRVDNIAHRLTPIVVQSLGLSGRIPPYIDLLQLFDMEEENHITNIRDLQVAQRWKRKPDKSGLLPFPVKIGSESYSKALTLHLAENCDGPHGVVGGTTGSGKSELLQSIVCALALEHHPYLLNFVLVDFKGGSTFGVFEELPHTVGFVSNLDKLAAQRALEAIKAENLRRQHFLLENDCEDIGEYHRKLNEYSGLFPEWEPLPHLIIIVDEFSELARDMPDFLPELVATVRVGRSLGLHLILATQRPAGVVTDEMRANLNFRISLRVQTIEDSRDMLRRPDAAMLPHNLPGRAYFQLGDSGIPRQFQSARVGGDYFENTSLVDEPELVVYRMDYERKIDLVLDNGKRKLDAVMEEKMLLADALARHLAAVYEGLRHDGFELLDPILLPLLPENFSLADTLRETSFSNDAQLTGWDSYRKAWLPTSVEDGIRVPVGKIDNLANRTQPPLWVKFGQLATDGHLAVLGAPASGKTTFLRTFVHGLVYRYAPDQAHVYIISFAGRSLEDLSEFPHVGDVVIGGDEERLNRLIRLLRSTVQTRSNLFADVQALDLSTYNTKNPASRRLPVIFVLIDGFGELKSQDYMETQEEITSLIQEGRTYGIYFIITAFQIGDISYKVMNLIMQRLALNLVDKGEYAFFVGRPALMDFDQLPSGMGFISGTPPMQFQLALPGDTVLEDNDQTGSIGFENMAVEMKEGCRNMENLPLPINKLERMIYLSSLLGKKPPAGKLNQQALSTPVGQDGDSLSLENFVFDWRKDGPHVLIDGPPRSGRTSVLHTFVLSIANKLSPDQAWFVLVDGTQGSLQELEKLKHVIARVEDEESLSFQIASLEAELDDRRKEYKLYNGQQAADFLQSKPRIFFVIDDYDMTRDALSIGQELLARMGKHLRQDADLGFHMIAAGIPRQQDAMIQQMKLTRTGVSLVDTEALDQLGGRITSAMRQQDLPEGRGYFLVRSKVCTVQFAFPDKAAYEKVIHRWKKKVRAAWKLKPTDEQLERSTIDSVSIGREAGTSLSKEWFGNPDDLVDQYIALKYKSKG